VKNIFSQYFMFLVLFSFADSIVAKDSIGDFLIRPWTVGQTATYQTKIFHNDQLAGTLTTTYSVVGQEKIKGKNYFWLEEEHLWKETGNDSILKVQVRPFKATHFENSVENFPRTLVKRRMMVLTGDGISESKGSLKTLNSIENGPDPLEAPNYLSRFYRFVSKEKVTVKAGVFDAEKLRCSLSEPSAGVLKSSSGTSGKYKITDTWGSPKIPIVGVIKSELKGFTSKGLKLRVETELLSYSDTGAVAKITNMPPDPWSSLDVTPTEKTSAPENVQ